MILCKIHLLEGDPLEGVCPSCISAIEAEYGTVEHFYNEVVDWFSHVGGSRYCCDTHKKLFAVPGFWLGSGSGERDGLVRWRGRVFAPETAPQACLEQARASMQCSIARKKGDYWYLHR